MAINCILKTKNQSHTFDLEKYVGNIQTFISDVYTVFDINTPVDMTTFFGVESEYFTNINDINTFLGIKFAYDYLPLTFLAWIKHTGNDINSFSKFNEAFQGVFHEPKDFCKQYIEKETSIKSMPTCVVECVDYQKMWDVFLNGHHFYKLKVEEGNIKGISVYIYAIFKN